MSVWVVVGGQFGSEGKGKVSAMITVEEEIDLCIRCGGPNSGHSIVDLHGKNVVLRQLPTGYIREESRLLIPAGGLIDLDVLRSELDLLQLDSSRVGVDRNAMIITDRDRERERDLGLSERLSSTLCGVGSAVARRVLRGSDVELAADAALTHNWLRPYLTDVSAEANSAARLGKKILVEGTQGSGLSLYHSGHFPKATSRDTNASGFLSEVGLSPRLVDEIVLVFRTFPIRVAGQQAGPLSDELSWEELQDESKSPVPLNEYTTVTKKLRRVGRFDWNQAARAVELNRPTKLAVNFLDYIAFQNRNAREFSQLTKATREFLHDLESEVDVPVCYLGAGPEFGDRVRPLHSAKTTSLDQLSKTPHAS